MHALLVAPPDGKYAGSNFFNPKLPHLLNCRVASYGQFSQFQVIIDENCGALARIVDKDNGGTAAWKLVANL